MPGTAPSDYERYLNTEELLALQKGPDEWVHRDELLFQVVHQSSELWLKLADARGRRRRPRSIAAGELGGAIRCLRRAALCLRYITDSARHARADVPVGVPDDPGGARARLRLRLARLPEPARGACPELGAAFHAAREKAGLSLVDLYVHGREHEELYQLAEGLIELDECAQTWRIRHYRVVGRVIGDSVVGTQGTPVEVLGQAGAEDRVPGALGRPQRAHRAVQGEDHVTLSRRGGRAPAGAAPAGHRQSARERDTGRGAAARATSRRNGVESRLVAKAPERANLVARLPGGDGPTMALIAHTDTVVADAEEWERDPWSGDLVDGEVWGRGALDMKGHVAAAAVAFASLAREGLHGRPATSCSR